MKKMTRMQRMQRMQSTRRTRPQRRPGGRATRLPAVLAGALAATLLAPALPAVSALPAAPAALAAQELEVVTTLPTYAAIAREITGDLARVRAIARGDVDPHFVNPRPSYAQMLQGADLFVSTGLDLELWVPGLLDRAGNARVVEGGEGHVVAYSGVELLDVPDNPSRAGGDIHVFGNPHIHTDPVNAILIGRNIVAGLERVDAANTETYRRNQQDFESRILERTFGAELVELVGAETLLDLARSHGFWDFARSQTFEGEPLMNRLGGWLAEAEAFRDRQMVCYHKNWAYFSQRFQIPCVDYVESKPGIPPSPRHVRSLIDRIRTERIPVLFAANYYSRSQVERVAQRAGATPVVVTEHVGGVEGVDDYFALVDHWIDALNAAFGGTD